MSISTGTAFAIIPFDVAVAGLRPRAVEINGDEYRSGVARWEGDGGAPMNPTRLLASSRSEDQDVNCARSCSVAIVTA